MTLLHADDRAYLVEEERQRYVLGDPADPLLVLNAVDDEGVSWVAEEPAGWDAPSVDLPIDRRQDGHGGIPGEPTYEERVLTVTGSAEAPDLATALRARQRLLAAWSAAVRTGEEVLYSHVDEAPARSLWVLPTGRPRVEVSDGRWLDYSFVLVAGDPIKRGTETTYGPAMLPAVGTEPGRRYLAGGRRYPRTYEGGAAGTVVATNLVANPSSINGSGWTGAYGAGAAGVRSTGVDGSPIPGGTYQRLTWTTAQTATTGALGYLLVGTTGSTANAYVQPVNAGESYRCSLWVRSSRRQRLALHFTAYTAAGAQVGTTIGLVEQVVEANVWTRLQTVAAMPATAVRAVLRATSLTTSDLWQAGDTLDATGVVLVSAGTIAGSPIEVLDYFDGSTPDTAEISYAWTGTPYASSSTATTVLASPYAATRIENEGDEDADAVYRITGPVPRPIVQLATGEYLRLDLDLAALDEAVADTESGTVYVNGTNRSEAIAPGSSFPLIPPGGAEVRLRSGTGATNTSARLYVTTAPRWT